MNRSAIEHRVHQIIDSILARHTVEDDLVEAKACWPTDHHRAARQIAGLANAARGADALWIVGIDEKGQALPGAQWADFDSWWGQVESRFDGQSPEMDPFNVFRDGTSVVAIPIRTDRPPYVVKSQDGVGQIHREVPWRAKTGLRTARRDDLLRILIPITRLPEVELLHTIMRRHESSHGPPSYATRWQWHLRMALYLMPMDRSMVVMPNHRASVFIQIGSDNSVLSPLRPELKAPYHSSPSPQESAFGHIVDPPVALGIRSTPDELVIDGPGKFFADAHWNTDPLDIDLDRDMIVTLVLRPLLGDERAIRIVRTLRHSQDGSSTDSLWSVGSDWRDPDTHEPGDVV